MIKQKLNPRTLNYVVQVASSIFYKFASIGLSYALVPLSISFLGLKSFGSWSVILMIMTWVLFLDLGIGNGLKNRVAESIAQSDLDLAREYISTAYCAVGVAVAGLLIVTILASAILPWNWIIGVSETEVPGAGAAMKLCFAFVLLNFFLSLISYVLSGLQKSSVISLIQASVNAIMLIALFFLNRLNFSNPERIVQICLSYGVAITLANITVSIIFFFRNPQFSPRLYCVKRIRLTEILGLSFKFAIIQLSTLLLFATDKLIISHLFGPAAVATYEVTFRYFNVIVLVHGLISVPLWAAYTDAAKKGDWIWIKKMIKRQIFLFFGIFSFGFVMLCIFDPLAGLWVKGFALEDKRLAVALFAFCVICCWNNIFAMFVNGIGRINVQMWIAVVCTIATLPVAVSLAHTSLGVAGVVVGTALVLMLPAVVLPAQVKLILKG